jgi:nucleotide-binding universal stress UspA family protein
VAMARWYGAQVTAFHAFVNLPIIDPVPLYRGQVLALADVDVKTLRTRLRELAGSVARDAAVTTEVSDATDVRSRILERAAELGCDLIVMGTHGRSGFERVLLGSVAEKVARKAPCPVMLVPPGATDGQLPIVVPFTRIVCPIDIGDNAARALDLALALAQEADADLTLLHAIEIPPHLRELAMPGDVGVAAVHAVAEAIAVTRLRDMVPADAGIYCRVHTEVREGRAYAKILEVAAERQANLIVMGVHGRGIDRLMLGSNVHPVLCGATCPVLIVRPVSTQASQKDRRAAVATLVRDRGVHRD